MNSFIFKKSITLVVRASLAKTGHSVQALVVNSMTHHSMTTQIQKGCSTHC